MNITDKIINLRNKVPDKGATEAEAMSALEKADELMAKHGITEADLSNAEYKKDMKAGEMRQKQKQRHPAAKFCAMTIGEFCGVKLWGSGDVVTVFGFNGDVEMAEFLYALVRDSMDRGWKEFLKENPKEPGISRHTQYWSFMLGFSRRINEKLRELIDARRPAKGKDLVVVKMAVVEAGRDAMFPSLNLNKARNASRRVTKDAMDKGKAAGDRINLQRPLKSNGFTQKKIAG